MPAPIAQDRLIGADGCLSGDCARAETGRRPSLSKIDLVDLGGAQRVETLQHGFLAIWSTAVVSTCTREMWRQSTLLAAFDWQRWARGRSANRCDVPTLQCAGGLKQCQTGLPERSVTGFGCNKTIPVSISPFSRPPAFAVNP